MPRFAANLSMLWQEIEPYERFRVAADAGFRRVEMLFPHQLATDRLERALRDHGLDLVLFDPAPGDWAAGERGLLCLPGREAEFRQTLHDAVALAQRLGTRMLNALAGVLPDGVPRAVGAQVALANLRAAAPIVERAGITLLVEAINPVDVPGYFADSPERAVALVEGAGSHAVRFQLDQYHTAMAGGDARAALRAYGHLVAHVQIADVPGRHEPGTGQQPIQQFLADLDAGGYSGHVGLEYRPLGSTEDSLAWLPPAARG